MNLFENIIKYETQNNKKTYLVTKVMCSSSLLGHCITFNNDSNMPQETSASPPLSYDAKWYKNEKRAVASGCGKTATAVAGATALVPAWPLFPLLVRLMIQLRTMTGRNPWKLAAPVASIIVFNLGLRSRWIMEVRAFRTAALISIRWSPFISSTSTSSSNRPEYSRPWMVSLG